MINIEIDGRQVDAAEGSMLIEAADNAGIYIPRFCYHKKLSIAANCRMCLVEVENVSKPLPACATPVTAGMKVRTKSKLAMDAQRAVMEFLLINHPLDCPICDQGGECELQDLSMGYGSDLSRYTLGKRSVKDQNIGPLVATDMTRCIHCTRCVRFGDEIAGMRELGMTYRGEHAEISTYVEGVMTSELSGNVIDICPVGALTSKPYRFTGRSWEMKQFASIAPHDCVGSNIYGHTLSKFYQPGATVMRVVPRENERINETWISDRDRFSYEALSADARLTSPMWKHNGQWKTLSWQDALTCIADHLGKIKAECGAEQIGGIISPSATTEEAYLFQTLLRGLGSHNVDHRLREQDLSDQSAAPLYPGISRGIDQLEQHDAVLLIGSNVRHEQPMINHRFRKVALKGGAVSVINAIDHDYNYALSTKAIVSYAALPHAVAAVAKACAALKKEPFPKYLDLSEVSVSEEAQTIAEQLCAGHDAGVYLGADAMHHPHASALRAAAALITDLTGAAFGVLTDGANAAGLAMAGALPHRQAAGKTVEHPGLSVRDMVAKALSAYILFAVEPELDCLHSADALSALQDADFVVACTAFDGQGLREYADVLLPITPFSETSGTFVNAAGQWQPFGAMTLPQGDARPGWKVLRVLGNTFGLNAFEYEAAGDVLAALQNELGDLSGDAKLRWTSKTPIKIELNNSLSCVSEWHSLRVDSLVRHAPALKTLSDTETSLRMNSVTAKEYNVLNATHVELQGSVSDAVFSLCIDERVADHTCVMPAGFRSLHNDTPVLGRLNLKEVS